MKESTRKRACRALVHGIITGGRGMFCENIYVVKNEFNFSRLNAEEMLGQYIKHAKLLRDIKHISDIELEKITKDLQVEAISYYDAWQYLYKSVVPAPVAMLIFGEFDDVKAKAAPGENSGVSVEYIGRDPLRYEAVKEASSDHIGEAVKAIRLADKEAKKNEVMIFE